MIMNWMRLWESNGVQFPIFFFYHNYLLLYLTMEMNNVVNVFHNFIMRKCEHDCDGMIEISTSPL
jgi:hypothetical protein